MDKVIPKVGQVWICTIDETEESIVSINGSNVDWSDGATSYLDDGYFNGELTFKPANDLEWLAVNCDTIPASALAVCKFGNQVEFRYGDNGAFANLYLPSEVIIKRNELFGLEDKPAGKVNMIDEYVKVNFGGVNWISKLVNEAESSSVSIFSFKSDSGEDVECESMGELVYNAESNNIYRKVSRPITWQEALQDYLANQMKCRENERPYFEITEGVLIEGSFSGTDFIEMCALVTSLTRGDK